MHPFVKFDLDVRRGDVFGQQRCSAIVILTMIVPNLNNYLDPVTEELMRASYWPLPRDGGQKGVNSGTATDEETSKRTSFFHKMMVMCVNKWRKQRESTAECFAFWRIYHSFRWPCSLRAILTTQKAGLSEHVRENTPNPMVSNFVFLDFGDKKWGINPQILWVSHITFESTSTPIKQ